MCLRATDITSEWAENRRVWWELKTRRSLLISREAHRQSANVGALDAESVGCFSGLFQLGFQQQLVLGLDDFSKPSKPETFCLPPPADMAVPTDRRAEENTDVGAMDGSSAQCSRSQFYIFCLAQSPPHPSSSLLVCCFFSCCAYICIYLTVLAGFLSRGELGSLPLAEPPVCLSAALSRSQEAIALNLLGHDFLSCVLWTEVQVLALESTGEGEAFLVGMKGRIWGLKNGEGLGAHKGNQDLGSK